MSSAPTETSAATPWIWRAVILGGVVALTCVTWFASRQGSMPLRLQSGIGLVCLLGIVLAFSANIRRINWRTVGAGLLMQLLIGLFILKLEIFGHRPGYELFQAIARVVTAFLDFSKAGASFVFGVLADQDKMDQAFGKGNGFVFAFVALPTIIFVSSFFTFLYHIGVLPFIVRQLARVTMLVMGTSGAETLSGVANVFMGQTEAPLIVKPYLARMTDSELLSVMVGGMATIAGGVMAVYIGLGADAVAIMATSVMAAPAGLYVSKILLPEIAVPETRGFVSTPVEKPHRNVIDALSSGASEGVRLAINVAAMLIAFLALVQAANAGLALISDGCNWLNTRYNLGFSPMVPLSLEWIFARVFGPAAFLLGVAPDDVPKIGELLGKKLVLNEFVAYLDLTGKYYDRDQNTVVHMSRRSYRLATYALTGFANIASIGIQIGGIGTLAPERRPDLAKLGLRALLGGFMTTMINAAMAGMLEDLQDA